MQNQIIATWKTLARAKQATASDTLSYILIRADGPTEALYHIRRAFSPVRNKTKLANGRFAYDCLWTNENWALQPLLRPYPMASGTKEFVRNHIKTRFQKFGVEPTEEQIAAFESNYIHCCKSLGY